MDEGTVDELQRVWELKEKGAISEQEYLVLKGRILAGNANANEAASEKPTSDEPVAGTDAEFRNNSAGMSTGKVVAIACAAAIALILLLAAIGSSGTNASSNAMNIDENLTTTDMNAVDMNATDMNVSDATLDENATSPASNESGASAATDVTAVATASLPTFDTASYCRKIGDTAGGSYEIEETCRDEEAKALAQLNASSIPDRTLRYCSDIGDTAGGSYEIMETCVEQEGESASRL